MICKYSVDKNIIIVYSAAIMKELFRPALLLFTMAVWLAAGAATAGDLPASTPPQSDRLRSFIRIYEKAEAEPDSRMGRQALFAALDAGEEASDFLIGRLQSASGRPKEQAGAFLSYIGGRKAVDALLKAQQKDGSGNMAVFCALAMGSTGSKEDVQYLIKALKKGGSSGEKPAQTVAAHTLGLLKAKEAVDALAASLHKDGIGNGWASDAAQDAITWISGKKWKVPSAEGLPEEEKIIFHLFSEGFPYMEWGSAFKGDYSRYFENARKRVWQRNGRTWEIIPAARSKDASALINFRIHISPDGSRALVAVFRDWFVDGAPFSKSGGKPGIALAGFSGPISQIAYDCLLVKSGGEWKTKGVIMTWVY